MSLTRLLLFLFINSKHILRDLFTQRQPAVSFCLADLHTSDGRINRNHQQQQTKEEPGFWKSWRPWAQPTSSTFIRKYMIYLYNIIIPIHQKTCITYDRIIYNISMSSCIFDWNISLLRHLGRPTWPSNLQHSWPEEVEELLVCCAVWKTYFYIPNRSK